MHCDDAIVFDLNSLIVKNITEFKKYPSLNISITSYLDKTKNPVSIDIGFEDIVYPQRVIMDFPVLLNMQTPTIFVYSIYSVIAEKFEAIVTLGLLNSRYKDFYDIYMISKQYEMVVQKLLEAIKETFKHRGINFDDIVAFDDEYVNNADHKNRCKSFVKKNQVSINLSFKEIVNECKNLLLPVIEGIKEDRNFDKIWNVITRIWE